MNIKLVKRAICSVAVLGAVVACSTKESELSGERQVLTSPDSLLEMELFVNDVDGTPYYSLNYKGEPVILPSAMGFELRGVLKAQKIEIENHFVDFKLNILAAKGYQLPVLPELHNDFLKDSMKNSEVK